MVGSGLGMGRTMKVIVSGARGCGKTSILEKVIYDNNGVSPSPSVCLDKCTSALHLSHDIL